MASHRTRYFAAAVLVLACEPGNIDRHNKEKSEKAVARSAADVPVREQSRAIPEHAVETTLRGGDRAAYDIQLDVDDYLHVVIEQKGIDVVVALIAPNEEELLTVDSPTGTKGREDLHAVMNVAGTYRLEVRPLGANAALGRFQIHLAAHRSATSEDRMRAEAVEAVATAERLRLREDLDDRQAAALNYERAIALWQKVGERFQEGVTRSRLGQLRFNLGSIESALEQYHEALRLARELDRRDLETTLLNDTGSALRLAGRTDEARVAYERALELARTTGQRREEMVALNNLALLHRLLGEPWQALLFYEQALAGWRQMMDREGEATTLHNLGATYLFVHRLSEARVALEQALALRRASGHRAGEAITRTILSSVAFLSGQFDAAQENLTIALALRRAVGDRRGEAVTLDHLATLRMKLGEETRALSDYEDALAVFRQVGDRLSEAHTLSNLGELRQHLGDLHRARESYDAALYLFQKMKEVNGAAYVMFRRADALRELEDLSGARTDIEQSLALVESLRDAARSPSLRASYFASVHDHYELYLDILMSLHSREPHRGYDIMAFEASERSRARNLLEELDESDSPLDALTEQEQRLEKAIRARQRQRLTAQAGGEPPASVEALDAELSALLLERETKRTAARVSRDEHSPGSAMSRPLTTDEIRRQVLDDDSLLLAYFLGEERSYVFAVDRHAFTSHPLPPRAEIEASAVTFHRLLRRSHRRGAAVQTRLMAEALGDLLLGPVAGRLAGQRLLVIPDGALHLVPFAALAAPGAGHASGEAPPLVVTHETIHLPSASAVAALRRTHAQLPRAPRTLAVVADPVFSPADSRLKEAVTTDFNSSPPYRAEVSEPTGQAALTRSARDAGINGFERLPFTEWEAEAILDLIPLPERFSALGLAANREVVLNGELSRYRILHFATHGLLHSSHPELSGLVLSLVDAAGRPRDGFLRAYEIADLDLPAELVVLSACHSALGRTIEGEGLVGLPRSFLDAGAERVLVSLWEVSDQGTALLMQRFYEGLLRKGLRPTPALREAQLSLWREVSWQAPYFWAGFVLVGEWR